MQPHPRRRWLNAPVLFLDYDGVLHPDDVYARRIRKKRHIFLSREGHALFEWVDLLRPGLEAAPHTAVVLSTSWVKALGFSYAKAQLPDWLQARVVGGTWHQRDAQLEDWGRWWEVLTRYEQITQYVEKRRVSHWVAVDDHDELWAAKDADQLVKTDSTRGLAEPAKAAELADRLRANEQAWLNSPFASERLAHRQVAPI